jgi:hypothetical protein
MTMARKVNNVYVKIAQTFRAWERKYPNQKLPLRVAAFDRIADGFFAAEYVTDKAISMIEDHIEATR